MILTIQTGAKACRLLLGLAALITLSACQSLTTADLQGSKPLAANQQLVKWRAEGKIKIVVDGETHSAAFDWQQHKANYAIHFFGPFGAGSSWLRRTSKGITLELPDRPIMRAATPEQLLRDTIGWQAPIDHLQHWIKGIPAPKAEVTPRTDITNEGVAFEQAGWHVSAERLKAYDSFLLPGKVTGTDGNTQVTVIIKRWEKR